VGLVARAIEATGTPTVCLTAARSITAAANPPRAAFVEMPLGYTAGRPHDPAFQTDLLNRALTATWSITEPGTIVDIGVQWSDDQSWKDAATSGLDNGIRHADGDSRSPRLEEPQYQYESDRAAAEAPTA
jgi:hypothetical protein|tara:strand:- start:2253 stop:2642 length:390 start_codon:yes stop_codon:yes gene_type:complete